MVQSERRDSCLGFWDLIMRLLYEDGLRVTRAVGMLGAGLTNVIIEITFLDMRCLVPAAVRVRQLQFQ